jgi:hypothetical protein
MTEVSNISGASVDEFQNLTGCLARERQQRRDVGGSRCRLESNQRELIRAQWRSAQH